MVHKGERHFFRLLFQISDTLTVLACWGLAYWIRFDIKPDFLDLSSHTVGLKTYFLVGLALVFVWYISLEFVGSYKRLLKPSFMREIWTIARGSLVAFLISVTAIHFLARDTISRGALVMFLGIVVVGLVLERSFIRSVLKSLRAKGWKRRRLIFVGASDLAQTVAEKVMQRKDLGIEVLGLVPIDQGVSKLKNLGNLNSLSEIISNEGALEVIVCLRNEHASELNRILEMASIENVYVRVVPDVSQFALLGFELEEFDGVPIVSLNQSPMTGWNSILKRVSDIIYSLTALAIFSPLILVVSILVKLTSRGPLFYGQERMGLDGELFHMYKFRSMRVDAEEKTGAVWAKENDNRVTGIGKFLRKTSLDELPQLFNVLKGDMSCVGPRPERPVFVDKFRKEIPGYMLRHKVKAGMTGWAQINGFRGNTSLEGRIEHDLYYITHWSLMLDFKIMFLTIFKGFINPNAY